MWLCFFNSKAEWIWMQKGSLYGKKNYISAFFLFLAFSLSFSVLAGGRKVIRLTSLDRSGSANILKNNSYSNLWPFGSIINSAKTRGSQTALPDRGKFLVLVMFAFCLAGSLTAYKQWYHSPSTQSDSETYIFIVNVLSPPLFHTVSDSTTSWCANVIAKQGEAAETHFCCVYCLPLESLNTEKILQADSVSGSWPAFLV